MNKSEKAREICDELGLDYYQVYNEDGANVTAAFLDAVHDEVVDDVEEDRPTAPASFKVSVRGEVQAGSEPEVRDILADRFGKENGGLECGRVDLMQVEEILIDEAVLEEARKEAGE